MVIFLQNRNGLMITLLEKNIKNKRFSLFVPILTRSFDWPKNLKILSNSPYSHGFFFEKMYVFCQFTSGFHEKWSIIGYFRKIRFLISPPPLTKQSGINFRWWFEIKCIILPPCGPETGKFYLFTFWLFGGKKVKWQIRFLDHRGVWLYTWIQITT